MLKELKTINERLISIYKNSPNDLKKQILIKEILQDSSCFFNIDIAIAYQILRDLKVPEDKIKEVYLELIDSQNYHN